MCLKNSDFNRSVVVESAITPAAVSVRAFPLRPSPNDGDDLLVQVVDGAVVETPSQPTSGQVCRGQVNSSNVKSYLIEIMDLCQDVERSLTRSFKVWKAEKHIPDLDEISDDVFSHGISIGPVVRCFDGDPPDPIVKTAEVISVRIERKLAARLSLFERLEWFMVKIVQTIRETFKEKSHSDVVVLFYDSVFDLDRAKRQNDLIRVDLNIQNGSASLEKKALVKHLEAFCGEQRVSQALRPLNLDVRAKDGRLQRSAETHGTLEAEFFHKERGATERPHRAASVTPKGGEMQNRRNGNKRNLIGGLDAFDFGFWTILLSLVCWAAFLALDKMPLALAASIVAAIGGITLMFAALELGDQNGDFTRES